jgi:hypothetical protein
MTFDKLTSVLKGHPLSSIFQGPDQGNDICWEWSSICVQDKLDWEKLPPDDNKWGAAGLIRLFIKVMLSREYFLYGKAYQFLMNGGQVADFNPDKIIP